jgi:hypothetical protein
MEPLGDVGHVKSHVFSFIVLESVQDRWTICVRRTIGSEIILDAPDGAPRWQGSSESLVCLEILLILMQDRCTVCVKHTIGSKIILDAPDDTLRSWGSSESSVYLEKC